jgi:hypothetical protein
LAKAQASLSSEQTGDVTKSSFNKGLFLAANLFSQRLAQHRFLVIKSCGNCLPGNWITSKYTRKLAQRNVVVHSWGNYEIKNVEDEDAEDEPFGYDNENIFLINKETNEVDSDLFENYKIDHKVDLCQRLAIKTKGQVINVNKLKEANIVAKVDQEFLNAESKQHSYKIGKCQKLDTPYGDLTDFSYVKKEIEEFDEI